MLHSTTTLPRKDKHLLSFPHRQQSSPHSQGPKFQARASIRHSSNPGLAVAWRSHCLKPGALQCRGQGEARQLWSQGGERHIMMG